MAEPVDDQTIVDGLLRGDPEAQIQLLQAYAEPLVRFLHYTYPVELADAEDIAVETSTKQLNVSTHSEDQALLHSISSAIGCSRLHVICG